MIELRQSFESGPAVMALAKYAIASEVARQQGGCFVDAMDCVRTQWPHGDTPVPVDESGWRDGFVDITDRAVKEMESRFGTGDL